MSASASRKQKQNKTRKPAEPRVTVTPFAKGLTTLTLNIANFQLHQVKQSARQILEPQLLYGTDRRDC